MDVLAENTVLMRPFSSQIGFFFYGLQTLNTKRAELSRVVPGDVGHNSHPLDVILLDCNE